MLFSTMTILTYRYSPLKSLPAGFSGSSHSSWDESVSTWLWFSFPSRLVWLRVYKYLIIICLSDDAGGGDDNDGGDDNNLDGGESCSILSCAAGCCFTLTII